MKATFKVDPSHEFAYELSKIRDEKAFVLAIKALNNLPDYFWFVPASSSGKHHPVSSLGLGGLVRHVKSVARVAIDLLANPMISADFSEEEQDTIIVAILLHDGCKQGFEPEPSHTLHEHPILVRNNLMPHGLNEWETEYWGKVCALIETHMGPWNTSNKSDIILEVPTTPAQKFVHMCDYIASRAIINVDTTDRNAQLGYQQNDPSKDAWKLEPAKQTQVDYMASLYAKAKARGIPNLPNPEIGKGANGEYLITKGDASVVIDNLKSLLGFQ